MLEQKKYRCILAIPTVICYLADTQKSFLTALLAYFGHTNLVSWPLLQIPLLQEASGRSLLGSHLLPLPSSSNPLVFRMLVTIWFDITHLCVYLSFPSTMQSSQRRKVSFVFIPISLILEWKFREKWMGRW
jgi:hypothetical protein